jgi:hypothetical protein
MTRAIRVRDLAFMYAAGALSRVCRVLYLIDERLGLSARRARERERLARKKARRKW